ncbi:hypothetical protein NDU88_005528 [Pleurodeles waltl]|uniref:Uncharacterized protein n=1 Tax=Pleurodeles waltl TaxID=8319 RepID=A0AAV7RLA9_PLEWA|nr:hypothetical protein NDU88_005528 [Pleurodeles waltl]
MYRDSMLLDIQAGTVRFPYIPSQPVRSFIRRVIYDVIVAVAGLAEIVRTLPYALKISMAPKAARNSEDKSDGSKATRTGRNKGDKGDLAGINRRPALTTGKLTRKNMSGPGKDAKISDNATPLPEVRGKGKSQSTTTSFLAWVAQDSCSVHMTLPSETNSTVVEIIPSEICSEKTIIESNEPLIKTRQGTEDMSGALDNCIVIRRKEGGPLAEKEQPQAQPQAQRTEDLTRVGAASAPSAPSATSSIEEWRMGPLNPKGVGKITEKDLKTSDWAKDSSDKFNSLTEESDVSSGEHSLSETGSSETSETGNKSSSNEPTVWQLRRHRKCTKVRPGSQEGLEFPTSTGSRTLKWDYSRIRLTETSTTSGQEVVNNKMEGSAGSPASGMCLAGTDSGMLQSIYNSIKEFQTETRTESRRARVATKRLQGTVHKVAKSCTEIEAKLSSMEKRIGVVEEDVDALKQLSSTRDDQLKDVMWELEDFENRQRRNNLRFLGIAKGLEGSDIQTYMIKLLRNWRNDV